ncbi:GntR family transcriptional regulator [Paenibacillus sp. GCM10027628]|uniref:GntR family transcriptional regulator n=1 Tax=Paenibacillus sp. GCM10027628 TaxID=3273413 RepID=UPI0036430818
MYAFEKITQHLRQRIIDREWISGGRLPSSRELAGYYNASVNTVEKAIKELVTSGLLKRDSRRGTYIDNGVTLEGVKGGSGLVAAFVMGIDNPLWSSALRGIEDVLHTYGLNLLPSSDGQDFDKLEVLVKRAVSKGFEGIIMCPIIEQGQIENFQRLCNFLLQNDIKIVFLDRYVHELNVPFVTSDNMAGAYKLTNQLIAQGHRKILFIRNSNVSTFNERLLGFKQAILDGGMEWSSEYDLFIPTRKENFEDEKQVFSFNLEAKLKSLDFTAVFTANDQIAEATLLTIERMRKEIPTDISMVTYDADNLNRRLGLKIAGMNQPFYEMGQLAAKKMLNLIEGKAKNEAYGHICKSELRTGTSIAFIPQ